MNDEQRPPAGLRAIQVMPDQWAIRLRHYDDQGRRCHTYIATIHSKHIGADEAERYAREFSLSDLVMTEIERLRTALAQISNDTTEAETRDFALRTLSQDWAEMGERHRTPLTLEQIRKITEGNVLQYGPVTIGPDGPEGLPKWLGNSPPRELPDARQPNE